MATIEQCEAALYTLAARMAAADPVGRKTNFDRTLSCTVRDLQVTFAGKLKGGELLDIRRNDSAAAQITLKLTGDDLLALVDGRLNVPAAWATGRLKIDASMLDLVRLKSIFR